MRIKETSESRYLPAAETRETRKPQERDRVSIGSESVSARDVESARAAAVGNRAARVRELEAAIKAGTYKPDASRIAQQILDDAELTARLRALLG